jgi:hypothetical protein
MLRHCLRCIVLASCFLHVTNGLRVQCALRPAQFRKHACCSCGALQMLFSKRPEELALGDTFAPEQIAALPHSKSQSFLQKLVSKPRNIRRTIAVGDVIVPVIGARDGWSGKRSITSPHVVLVIAYTMLRSTCTSSMWLLQHRYNSVLDKSSWSVSSCVLQLCAGIRQHLVNCGVYPGVEYRCLAITDTSCSSSSSSSRRKSITSCTAAAEGSFENGSVLLTLQPVYPLVTRLERVWPVTVPGREIPIALTPFAYNAATAWAAVLSSVSLAVGGAVLAATFSLSFIPSRSMEPTLLPVSTTACRQYASLFTSIVVAAIVTTFISAIAGKYHQCCTALPHLLHELYNCGVYWLWYNSRSTLLSNLKHCYCSCCQYCLIPDELSFILTLLLHCYTATSST